MPDLADRISRGAVAALDLAPFDNRFSKLSRQVLAGGASRFARVVTDDEPVQFVVPVGLPHDRIEYGALVLQSTRVGVIWRDAAGADRHRTATLDSPATFSSVTLGGEEWMRFDVPDADAPLTFLVPPVSSPLLRSTLIQLLHARPGTPAVRAIPEPEPEPAPFRMPDPTPEPVAPIDVAATVAAEDPTAVLPTTPAAPTEQPTAEQTVAGQFHAAEGAPDREAADDVTRVHPVAAPPAAPSDGGDDLFRDSDREAPAATPALPTPTPTPPAQPETTRPLPTPTPAPAVPVAAGGGMSLTVRGFLIGFVCALFGGGLALALQVIGG